MTKAKLKTKLLALVWAIITVAFFVGCSLSVDSAERSESAVSFAVKNFAARSIMPVKGELSDYTYMVSGKFGSESEQNLFSEKKAYSALSAASVPLKVGTWTFTMTAYKGDVAVLRGTQSSVQISAANQNVSFTLEGISGKGTVQVTLEVPATVTSAKAGLFASPGAAETGTTSLTPSANKVTYTNNNAESGVKYVKFFLYEGSALVGTYIESVYVSGGLTSSAERKVSEVDGGTFAASVIAKDSKGPTNDYVVTLTLDANSAEIVMTNTGEGGVYTANVAPGTYTIHIVDVFGQSIGTGQITVLKSASTSEAICKASVSVSDEYVTKMGEGDTPSSIYPYKGGINKNDDYRTEGLQDWNSRNKWNLANVHDPSVAYWSGDGYYYMYQTDAGYGDPYKGHGHFQGRRSKDLVNWEYVGMAFPENGAKYWILEKVNEIRTKMNLEPFTGIDEISWGYWAPTVKEVNTSHGKVMRMYYDVVVDNYIYSKKTNTPGNFDNSWTERAFIGMAECTDPAKNNWVDKGYVLCSSSVKGSNHPAKSGATAPSSASYYRASASGFGDTYFYFNAIDPTYFFEQGDESKKHYLIYGSWHHGFAGLEIDRESGMPVGHFEQNADGTYKSTVGDPWADDAAGLAANGFGTRMYYRNGVSGDATWQPSEGPEVIYKDGKYYMFFANDGLDVPYHTRVVRSSSPISGYLDIYGRGAEGGNGKSCYPIVTHPYKFADGYGWVGISHCTVFEKDGEWFFSSQGRLPAGIDNYSNAVMMGHVRKILWVPNGTATNDLWPIASPERYANIGGKDAAIADADIVGTWEHINLVYNYGKQNVSQTVTFNENKSVTGAAFTGTWSFDATKKYLTITLGTTKPNNVPDSSIILVLDREYDWEKKQNTIVYAGVSGAKTNGLDNNAPTTFWGKKVAGAVPITYYTDSKKYTMTTEGASGNDKYKAGWGGVYGTIPAQTKVELEGGIAISFKLENNTTDQTCLFDVSLIDSDGNSAVQICAGYFWENHSASGEGVVTNEATSTLNQTVYDGMSGYVTLVYNYSGNNAISYYVNGELKYNWLSSASLAGTDTPTTFGQLAQFIVRAIKDEGFPAIFGFSNSITAPSISDIRITNALTAQQAQEFYETYGK